MHKSFWLFHLVTKGTVTAYLLSYSRNRTSQRNFASEVDTDWQYVIEQRFPSFHRPHHEIFLHCLGYNKYIVTLFLVSSFLHHTPSLSNINVIYLWLTNACWCYHLFYFFSFVFIRSLHNTDDVSFSREYQEKTPGFILDILVQSGSHLPRKSRNVIKCRHFTTFRDFLGKRDPDWRVFVTELHWTYVSTRCLRKKWVTFILAITSADQFSLLNTERIFGGSLN